ncbi:protein rep, partial [Streptococcus thermophilus]
MTDFKKQGKILVDKNSRGKERDWRGRKILSLKLADIFKELQYKKTFIERVISCGDTLQFI